MLHILHAADLHLDAPFAALTTEQAAQRRSEQRELLARLAEVARSRRADLVLLSGDLLDGGAAYAETAAALSRALAETLCPVLIAPGNHDFWSPRGPYASLRWPENVHIFSSPDLTAADLPGLNCAVWGAAFSAQYRDDSPLDGFRAPDDGRIHLGVLHGDVGGKSRYCPIRAEEIAASGLAYLAMGHVHASDGLQKAGETYWAYSGCPEGRGFDELGEKGALWLTAEPGRVTAEFVPLALRRYEILEVDVSGGPEAALRAALPRNAQNDSYRILLTGESGVEGLDLKPLRALAEPYFYSLDLRDRTKVRRDLWERAAEDTLTGLFLRGMRARLKNAADPDAAALIEDAVRFGLAALENGEDRP
ncbi:MAG: DNA repair exonuclease [Clostridia bacterium]|nr:DNA repair exonuclease [Clostridia bacterium]